MTNVLAGSYGAASLGGFGVKKPFFSHQAYHDDSTWSGLYPLSIGADKSFCSPGFVGSVQAGSSFVSFFTFSFLGAPDEAPAEAGAFSAFNAFLAAAFACFSASLAAFFCADLDVPSAPPSAAADSAAAVAAAGTSEGGTPSGDVC